MLCLSISLSLGRLFGHCACGQVGAIGGVLKAGSLTFIDDRTRFNNIAIKLKQLRLPDHEVRVLRVYFCRGDIACVCNCPAII